jgi:hypothetical protein
MSLHTLLQKIGEDIDEILDKSVKELDTVVLPAAIAVTNTVKSILTLDTTDIIGKLAGSVGAGLEDKVKQVLNALVPKLQLAQQFLSAGGDSATILTQVVKLLPNTNLVTQTAFYIEFSSMLAADLAPSGTLTLGQATQLAQYFFTNNPNASPAGAKVVASPTTTPTTTTLPSGAVKSVGTPAVENPAP